MSFSKASDCLFHPPGGSPFGKSYDNLHSNYHPSPANEVLNKKLTLTPERVTQRSEYALPPEKYTPEQYSFIKDDHISLDESHLTEPTKLPPPPVPKINWTASGIESLPSTDVTDPTLLFTPRFISVPKQAVVPVKIKTTFAENSDMPTSPLSQRLHQFRFGEPKPRSARTKMKESLGRRRGSINNLSNASKSTINQPKPSTKNQSNISNLKRVQKSPHISVVAKSKPSHKERAPTPDDDEVLFSNSTKVSDNKIKSQSLPSLSHSLDSDETCESLHSRLSQLLQETESVLSTSGEEVLTSRSSIVTSSAETTMNNRFNAYRRSPPPISRPRTASLNLPGRMSAAKQQPINGCHETNHRLPALHVETEDSTMNPSNTSIPQEDDILFQWRLRRKMTAARNAADEKNRNEYCNYMQNPVPIPTVPAPQQPSTAERPYDRNIPMTTYEGTSKTRPHPCCIRSQTRDAFVAAVPLTSSQTQTSKSLDEAWNGTATDVQHQEPDAIQATRSSDESTVSFHKVTVVKADSSPHAMHAVVSPKSTKTLKTDTSVWSSNDATQLQQTEQTSTNIHSPAGTAVKNVIGMRLFETPASVETKRSVTKTTPLSKPQEEVSSEEFNDSYNTILELPKKISPDDKSNDENIKEQQHERQNEVISNASVIDQVLEELENGVVDYPDDSVMQTLREQRLKYLQELGSIEEILAGWKS